MTLCEGAPPESAAQRTDAARGRAALDQVLKAGMMLMRLGARQGAGPSRALWASGGSVCGWSNAGAAKWPRSRTTVGLNPHDDTRPKEAGRWRALIYS